MMEEILGTARFNPKIDPSLGIWTWEIAFYLFLGGMTAGILFFAASTHLARRSDDNPSPPGSCRCGRRSCCRPA